MDLGTILAGFISGLIGSMGLGGGGVLLIYLTAIESVEQLKAQGINLLFFLPIGLTAILIYAFKKKIKWKIVLKLWIFGAIGVFLGYQLSNSINTEILRNFFALFLIAMGIYQILPMLLKVLKRPKQNIGDLSVDK